MSRPQKGPKDHNATAIKSFNAVLRKMEKFQINETFTAIIVVSTDLVKNIRLLKHFLNFEQVHHRGTAVGVDQIRPLPE